MGSAEWQQTLVAEVSPGLLGRLWGVSAAPAGGRARAWRRLLARPQARLTVLFLCHPPTPLQGDPYEELADWQEHHQGGRAGAGAHFELLAPVSDPLIARCLRAAEAVEAEGPGGGGGGGARRAGLALAAARAWRKLVRGHSEWLQGAA